MASESVVVASLLSHPERALGMAVHSNDEAAESVQNNLLLSLEYLFLSFFCFS